jgi:hypothetical protein
MAFGYTEYKPINLELLSPGSPLYESTDSYIYSTLPLFTWNTDYCNDCTYGIRVCEFDQEEHGSLQSALDDWSLLPYDQENQYHTIQWKTLVFQYPVDGIRALEVGKQYVWQIRRSYETNYEYSSIYIFEIRSPTKKQLVFSDPYLTVIQSLIGNKQFNSWFSPGGELEQFVTEGESIWINNKELHINALHLLVSELNKGKITIEAIQLK